MPHIHIVIPVHNQWTLTERCLATLATTLPRQAAHDSARTTCTFSLTVVDDGSSDSTARKLDATGEKLFGKRFSSIRLNRNKGFAAACNAGVQALASKKTGSTAPASDSTRAFAPHTATPDYIFFLNNDVEVTQDWHLPLLDAMKDNASLGAVSPLLLYPDSGRVQHCGYSFTPSLRHIHLFANLPAMHPAIHLPRKLQAISAAAMLVRHELFVECGGFHEGFRNGLEDIDLCARMRDKQYEVAIVTQSHALHAEQQTLRAVKAGKAQTMSTNKDMTDTELNTLLLNERTKGAFGPDLHRFAADAGLELELTPWLESYIKLPVEKEQALTLPVLEAFHPTECWKQLQQEPLWFTGYEILCNYLEQQGMFAELCGARLLQSTHYPMLPVYGALAEAAKASGNAELAEQTNDKMAHVTGLLEDPGPLIKKAAGMVNWAKKAKEPQLQELFEDWLKDLGML